MAERIDMSLDDIIKRDRIRSSAPRRGNKFTNRNAVGGTRGQGTVRKIGATTRQLKTNVRRAGPSPKAAFRSVPDKWTHDKFLGEAKSASLVVSNLHYNVSDQDLKELFGSFGTLKKVSVHYDASGRSLGKADVVFMKPIDAVKALKKYNGVPLDGRPMQIESEISPSAKKSIASRIGSAPVGSFKKSGVNPRSGRGNNSNRGRIGGGSGRGGGRGKPGQAGNNRARAPKKTPTQAELDADLDAFNNKME